jgi:molybdopterin converting factor small subunit
LQTRYEFPEQATMKVAINDEFSAWDTALNDGDRLVFIPPVAGG